MKQLFFLTKIIIVCAFTLVACKQNNIANDVDSNCSLTGTWRYDSLSFGKDSAHLPISFMLYALALHDSSKTYFRFSKDSAYILENDEITDRGAYNFNGKDEITIRDTAETNRWLLTVNDSLITLSRKDSITLYLKKI